MSRWRHLRAIALLPGMVAVGLPALILLLGDGADPGWGLPPVASGAVIALGGALVAAGAALWLWTVRLFARVGEGTLAPWDPTRRMVAVGPYERVRNPMISGVFAVLVGEALLFGSEGIAVLAAAFLVVNHLYFVAVEEPGLERRFGAAYRDYRAQVPRWIPSPRR